jgi:glycosyltransferase involved in cell wall biosynthesis
MTFNRSVPVKLATLRRQVHVCLVSTEFFDRRVFGGFGRAVRAIGAELAAAGVEVTAAVPARGGRPRDCEIDGIRLREFRPRSPRDAFAVMRDAGADVYHSQDPSLWTYVARRAAPRSRHVVTFRAPRTVSEWLAEWRRGAGRNPTWPAYPLVVDNPLTARAVRGADRLYVTARFLGPKAVAKYGLAHEPAFLPTPLRLPDVDVAKSATPLVCFVGRFDWLKRPELFFELARRTPNARFVAVGYAPEPRRDREVRRLATPIRNLELRDPVDQFVSDELFRVFAESWILVNTSVVEGLPTTFLEAAAYGCAVLSFHDPDGFATRFGHHARDIDDLAAGLAHLIEDDRWRELGAAGNAWVRATYDADAALEAHLRAYDEVLERDVPLASATIRG